MRNLIIGLILGASLTGAFTAAAGTSGITIRGDVGRIYFDVIVGCWKRAGSGII